MATKRTAAQNTRAAISDTKRTKAPAAKKTTQRGTKVDMTIKADAKAAKKVVAAMAKPAPAVAEVVRPARTNTYMTGENRKAMLDGHLLKVLQAKGINGTSRAELARVAGCSNSLLRVYYPGGVEAMRAAAVVLAATAGDAKTVKKALADGFPKSALPRKFHALVK